MWFPSLLNKIVDEPTQNPKLSYLDDNLDGEATNDLSLNQQEASCLDHQFAAPSHTVLNLVACLDSEAAR